MALILAGVSTGFWLLAAAVGRRLCNRALFPMTRMAKAACVMTAADRDHRLPSPRTGDELDALAGSFNGLLDRLHQEYERQKRFTGDASHQLRTPLTALLGQIEVARRRHRTTDEYERVLDEVHCEAIRLRQIVESLLFMGASRPRPNGSTCNPLISSPGSTNICANGPITSEPPIFMRNYRTTARCTSGFTLTCSDSCSTTYSTMLASTARPERQSASAFVAKRMS